MVEYWGKLVDAERKPYYYSVGFITIIVVVEYRREQRPRICGRSFCVVFVSIQVITFLFLNILETIWKNI